MELINEDGPRRSLANVRVGTNVRFFNFVNAYGCEVGDNTKVGSFVEIQKGARIGRNCKISSHSFVCEGVDIGDEVFIGHNVSFINDKFPRAATPDGSMQTEADWKVVPTKVGKGASIGTGSTILCGVSIGERAIVGAGSVVTRDVAAGEVVAGNPARPLRKEKRG
jgi:acetyltransferase-like isoleucine patch superfamily enzyme